MAHVESVWVYPIKGLDAVEVETNRLTGAGTLAGDRRYALVGSNGATHNGKQIETLHEISASYDLETERLTLSVDDRAETCQFDLTDERDVASEWFSEFVGEPLELRRRDPPSFVDRPDLGPSVISTGTLEEMASWFEGMTPESARRRLRPNVEIGGVPAFWEDQFLGEDAPAFEIGGVPFEGEEACARCVVPSRDPETGEPIEGFRKRFIERREATLPEWIDEGALKHFYTVMLITSVPDAGRGETIRVGDPVSIDDGSDS